jgi:hypothetical protein
MKRHKIKYYRNNKVKITEKGTHTNLFLCNNAIKKLT